MPPCGGAPYCSASSRKPNFALCLVGVDLERAKHLALHFLAVNPHRAAAELDAVEHDVIGLRQALARIAFEPVLVAVLRRRERVMNRVPALGFIVVFEHREIDHPKRLPFALDQAVRLAELAVADLDAQRADGVVDNLRLVSAEEQQVAVVRARCA